MAARTRAARLVAHGEPLVVEDVDLPEPADGEVVVTMRYAGVNPVDRYGALGRVAPDGPVPRTLGTEGLGTVGDRTVVVHGAGLGTTRDGLWAGAAVVPVGAMVDVPAGVDPVVAATVGVAGVTAWRAVHDLGRVGPEDRVLVLGASGGVGSMVVSMAAAAGAQVWGQTGSAAKADWLAAQGADQVVVADAPGLVDRLGDYRPTVVVDPLGGGFTGAAVQAMAPRGRLVLFGTSAGTEGEVPLQQLYRKSLTVYGYGGLSEPADRINQGIADVLRALADGVFTAAVDEVVPLGDVNRALDRLTDRSLRGKVVLDLQG
ncbi:MAG TPA: zinc-binding alcohol dehydrogenase family protein [Acidimicrobiales bacterium]|nr:zinc-binding alcohol dehydrogenase family protein [Acidimicrobiales bacterium]